MKRVAFITLVLTIGVMVACNKTSIVEGDYSRPNLPSQKYNYADMNLPDHVSGFELNIPQDNPITDAGATLGRVLFYDQRLSINNSTACASCHDQTKGFADPVAASTGFNFGQTKRNSPSCVNTAMGFGFFWDMRAATLEEQVLMPIQDHIEMGLDNPEYLVQKVNSLDYYAPLFEDAFGSPTATEDGISKAMAQFLRSLTSFDAKWDAGVRISYSNFTPLEREGFDLFFNWEKTHCASCHAGTNFSGWGTDVANIGLEMEYSDPGIGATEDNPELTGWFKVPSLRNVALTAPYMHDGRFATLEEVIDHYSTGVVAHPNLDWRMTENGGFIFFDQGGINGAPVDLLPFPTGSSEPRKLNLTKHEKEALIAFLHTLTDESLATDVRFSDPFNR